MSLEIFSFVTPKPSWLDRITGFPIPPQRVSSNEGTLAVSVGNKSWESQATWTRHELSQLLSKSDDYPVLFLWVETKKLWRFQGYWYWAEDSIDAEEVFAILTAREIRAKQSIDRAKTIAGMATQPQKNNVRGHIPPDLRQLVWMRDGGRCTMCGSQTELQFDHIIPVSMGGATSEQNLQILCGSCNRSKGSSVGGI